MAVGPEELLEGIVWVPAPETEGTFTFNSGPFRDARRQISIPRVEQSEIT